MLAAEVQQVVRRAGRVGAHEDLELLDLLDGDLLQRLLDDRDLISGGVRAGVAGPQDRGQRFAGLIAVGQQREIPIPAATLAALEAWLRAHPQRRGGGLRDDDVLFVSLARARASSSGAISQQGLAKLVRRYAAVAAVPERLAHPRALRGYYATTLAGERVPIQEIKARLGHASIETTARYLAELGDQVVGVGDILDRHHQAQRLTLGEGRRAVDCRTHTVADSPPIAAVPFEQRGRC